MKSTIRVALISVILLAAIPVFAIDASTDLRNRMKQMMQQNPELMHEMMSNPNHRLAMGYRNNLLNFAHVLKNAAEKGDSLPGSFVRAAAGEMRRSVDLLEKNHNEAMNSVSTDKRPQLADVFKLMHEHLADVRQRLDHLDQLSKEERVVSKGVLKDLNLIVEHCQMGMKGMHNGSAMPPHWGSGQDAELDGLVERMNGVADGEKVELMAEILTILVEKQRGLKQPMQGMSPYGMHPMNKQMPPPSPHQQMLDDTDLDEDMDIEEME